MLEMGEMVFPWQEQANCLSNTKSLALKALIQVTLNRLRRFYLYIYKNTHMHTYITTIQEKEAINFKEITLWVYGRVVKIQSVSILGLKVNL